MADINSLYAQKLAGEAGVSAGGPVGGIGGDLNSLLQNKMFLQFLMAGGQDIMQGTGGANLGGAVQQNIASQNITSPEFQKSLAAMMRGEIPEGGKIVMDGKGMTQMNVPASLFGKKLSAEAGDVAGTSMAQPMSGPATPQAPTMDNYLNPSDSQSGFPASSLAGVTPEMITAMMGLKLTQEDLGRKKVSDVADMYFKSQQLQQATVQDKPFPVSVPGVGQVTLRQWNALPADDKEYAIAKHQASQMGDSTFMSKSEWQMTEPTERQRFVQSALKDPAIMEGAKELAGIGDTADWKNFKKAVDQGYTGKFHEYQIEMRRAGATTIGDITGREKAKSELKGQLYFKNPDWTEDLSKHIDSEDVQNKIFQSDNPDQVRATETVKFIENKIDGGGGEVVETKWADESKTTIEWKVKWSTGDTTTVKYKVR